jgi:hypothetical protein
MRTLALGLMIATGLALSGLPVWAQVTTRIEPRPFYGATVSVEEGVRVFRPLPSHDRVIINPGYGAPVGLEGHSRWGRRDYYVYPPRSGTH